MEIARKKQKQLEETAEPNDEYSGAYFTYKGSPLSRGIYQFDMWGVEVTDDLWNWTNLKDEIKKYGVRNSLLLAPMPTASTSQIMGFNECFEPFTSNLYKRKTLAGEFIVMNKYLLKELIDLNLWNQDLKDQIIINEGMIGNIETIPKEIRDLYKTAWEIKQKHIIDMAADRGAFICQSQSMNLFMESPDQKKLTMMHFYAWQKGLKTGMYYLRTKPKANTQQFTINPKISKSNTMKKEEEEPCLTCSA
jgi:ribonucleoside-diphosphate reductase alpha chain